MGLLQALQLRHCPTLKTKQDLLPLPTRNPLEIHPEVQRILLRAPSSLLHEPFIAHNQGVYMPQWIRQEAREATRCERTLRAPWMALRQEEPQLPPIQPQSPQQRSALIQLWLRPW